MISQCASLLGATTLVQTVNNDEQFIVEFRLRQRFDEEFLDQVRMAFSQ